MILEMNVFLSGLFVGLMYGLVALSYVLVFGLLKVFNLAQAELIMAGAFAGLIAAVNLKLPLPIAFVVPMITVGVLSLLAELLCFRKVMGSGWAFAPLVTSLGFGYMVKEVFVNWTGGNSLPFQISFGFKSWNIGGVSIIGTDVLIATICVAMLVGVLYIVRKTRLGIALIATSENPSAATLMGINTGHISQVAFLFAGIVGGVAGMLYGLRLGIVSPYMGHTFGLKGLALIVIGGLGSIPGCVIAGIIIGILESFTAVFLSAQYVDLVAWGVLTVILILRPHGILGKRE